MIMTWRSPLSGESSLDPRIPSMSFKALICMRLPHLTPPMFSSHSSNDTPLLLRSQGTVFLNYQAFTDYISLCGNPLRQLENL